MSKSRPLPIYMEYYITGMLFCLWVSVILTVALLISKIVLSCCYLYFYLFIVVVVASFYL